MEAFADMARAMCGVTMFSMCLRLANIESGSLK